jgi:hypothetical protein
MKGRVARGLRGAARASCAASRSSPRRSLSYTRERRVAVPPEGDACRGSTKLRRRPSSMRRGPDGAGNGCAMVARSARWLRHYPWKHPRRNRQRRSLRYANPIHAASKATRHGCSGDQSAAREGQSTAGADTKERLNTCNRRLFTRALPTVPIQHRPSAALALSVLPAIRGHRPRQNATRSRRTPAEVRPVLESTDASR